jgi:MFS family permease
VLLGTNAGHAWFPFDGALPHGFCLWVREGYGIQIAAGKAFEEAIVPMPEKDADSPAAALQSAPLPSLLRRPQFFAYWSGGLVSNVGTWLQNVTASVLILDLTHKPVMVGVLNFATFAPIFALSMFGGMLSDRFDRRLVVIVSQGFSMAVAAVITVLTVTKAINATSLICLATLLGCSYAVAKPALAALLPALVERGEIAHATAVNTLQFNIGQVAGSALSAAVLAFGSYSLAFVLNTMSFAGPIVSMILLRRVRMPARASKLEMRGSGRAGLRLLLNSPAMVTILVAVALSNASVEALRTTAPELVNLMPGLTASSAGVLVTAYAAGATVGLLSFGWVSRHVSPGRVITAAFAMQAAGVLATAAVNSLIPAAVFALPIGLGFSLNIPVLSAQLQNMSTEEFRGRVMSLFSMAHLGIRPLFSLTAGALATVIDARAALALFAVFPIVAVVLVRRWSADGAGHGPPRDPAGSIEPVRDNERSEDGTPV